MVTDSYNGHGRPRSYKPVAVVTISTRHERPTGILEDVARLVADKDAGQGCKKMSPFQLRRHFFVDELFECDTALFRCDTALFVPCTALFVPCRTKQVRYRTQTVASTGASSMGANSMGSTSTSAPARFLALSQPICVRLYLGSLSVPVSISVRLCVRLLLRPCLPPLSLSLSVCVGACFALSQLVSVRACLLTLSQERALTCPSER